MAGEDEVQFELETDPSARGPANTVPYARFDVESYLSLVGDKVPEDPREALKFPKAPAPNAEGHYYSQVYQVLASAAYRGAYGQLNLWDVPDLAAGENSIMQIAMDRGTGSGHQTVEVGSIQFSGWNSGVPTLFVYYTTNNYNGEDDWLGGYNATVAGFCQESETIFPQTAITGGMSVTNGTQKYLGVSIERLDDGNWWVYVRNHYIGYYPKCKTCDSDIDTCDDTVPFLFSTSGMRNRADDAFWFGEVWDSSAPLATTTDMGSGEAASANYRKAAFIRNMQLATTTSFPTFDYVQNVSGSLGTSITDSDCYSMDGPGYNGGSAWPNWFFLGGDGTEAPGCN